MWYDSNKSRNQSGEMMNFSKKSLKGRYVFMSSGSGNQASIEKKGDQNSFFTSNLLKVMKEIREQGKNLTYEQVYKKIIINVRS